MGDDARPDPGRHQVRDGAGCRTASFVVIDEIHTPDSSRYWYADGYAEASRARRGPASRSTRSTSDAGCRSAATTATVRHRRCPTRFAARPRSATSRPTSASPDTRSSPPPTSRRPEFDGVSAWCRPRSVGRPTRKSATYGPDPLQARISLHNLPPFLRRTVGANGESSRSRRRVGDRMAMKVAQTGVKRQAGYLYYLDKQGDVSRVVMARGGGSPRAHATREGRARWGEARGRVPLLHRQVGRRLPHQDGAARRRSAQEDRDPTSSAAPDHGTPQDHRSREEDHAPHHGARKTSRRR